MPCLHPLVTRMPYAYTEPQNYVDESFFLALNTFYMSLKAYFDSTDKASPAIRENMQSFQSKYASAFHDLESLDDTFRAHMAQTGLALYNETLSPLARAWKCKDPAYVLKVVHSFTVYAQTTIPLWIARTQFKAPDKDMCFNVIDRHLLNILVKTSDPRRALVCLRLLFEAQAISQYLLLLEPLHATQRNDPKHPVVRGMFWAASYLYHSLDPLWDADRHAPCTQNLLAKAVPSEDLTCALRTQVYMSVERCLIRIFCKDKITFRLQSYLSSLKERNLLDSQKYALVHEHLALLQRFPHAGSLAFPPAQDLDLQCAIQVLASCVTPSLAMMTSRLQTATIFLELNAHEIQPAAPSSNPNKKKRRKSTLAKQRHAAQLCAIQDVLEALIAEVLQASLTELALGLFQERDLLARQHVLQRAPKDPAYALELLHALLPELQPALDPTLACFLCLDPLDFVNDSGILYLTCCAGGSFACSACLDQHHLTGHPAVGETHIVRHFRNLHQNRLLAQPKPMLCL